MLPGSSVVLTGGGSGLGRAITERFVREGATVVVLERSAEKAAALKRDFGGEVQTVVGDVRSAEDNQRAIDVALGRCGKLDAFVGVAAILDFVPNLLDIPVEKLAPTFHEVMDVNLLGYITGAYLAAKELKKTKGSITLTLSSSGKFAGGAGPFYTLSKHAGLGLVRYLALELGRSGVRVNGVIPGLVLGSDLRGPQVLDQHSIGLRERHGPGRIEAVRRMTPLYMVPEDRQYTGIYVLLASKDDAAVATGSIIDWDTGISAVGHGLGLADTLREGHELHAHDGAGG
jgi:2,3-dihydroxy-2,3-dihydrophenylpropionate dehydrogenase